MFQLFKTKKRKKIQYKLSKKKAVRIESFKILNSYNKMLKYNENMNIIKFSKFF